MMDFLMRKRFRTKKYQPKVHSRLGTRGGARILPIIRWALWNTNVAVPEHRLMRWNKSGNIPRWLKNAYANRKRSNYPNWRNTESREGGYPTHGAIGRRTKGWKKNPKAYNRNRNWDE